MAQIFKSGEKLKDKWLVLPPPIGRGGQGYIYKAKNIEDLWFIDWIGKDDTYKESIYPLTIFKGSQEKQDEGLDEIYKYIVNGRYGCYDGKWVNLDAN